MPENGKYVSKGSLITSYSQKTLPFMFNPTAVPRAHGWEWTRQTVPGRSHKFLGGGAGSDETHELTFYLDGERGRADARKDGEDAPFSIQGEINDWHSLTLVYDKNLGNAHGVPEPVLLLMGTILPSVRCLVNHVKSDVIFMTADLEPMKALVTVTFTVLELVNVSSFTRSCRSAPASTLCPPRTRSSPALAASPCWLVASSTFRAGVERDRRNQPLPALACSPQRWHTGVASAPPLGVSEQAAHRPPNRRAPSLRSHAVRQLVHPVREALRAVQPLLRPGLV